MVKPWIGVTGRRLLLSDTSPALAVSLPNGEVDFHVTEYSRAIADAGGIPIELSRDADAKEVVSRLDGLVLSGGSDISPSLYGATPHERLGKVDRERDDWELEVLAEATRRNIPILGVCRGCQLINVFYEGTLNQHVGKEYGVGHPAWHQDSSLVAHDIVIENASLLSGLFPRRIGVNSKHHQTLDRIGADLVVTARADDGVVEAIEKPGFPVLGVQWHPESLASPDPTFVWLVAEAQKSLRGLDREG
jgi:putative glutamine amidotransferase